MDSCVFYCLTSAVVLCKVVGQLEEVKTTLLVLIYYKFCSNSCFLVVFLSM